MLWDFLRGKLTFLRNEEGPFCGTVEFPLQSFKKTYIIAMMSFMYWKAVTESGWNPARSCVYGNFNFERKFLAAKEEKKRKLFIIV